MKIIVYTLTAEGTAPEYVTDGGYLYWPNGNAFPQDADLVGVAKDEAPEEEFADEASLLEYANSKGLEFRNSETKEIIPLENVVASIWTKK